MNQMTSSVETGLVPDAVAVERTLAGDRDAYRILVERHSQNVYRLAYRMAGNSHDASRGLRHGRVPGSRREIPRSASGRGSETDPLARRKRSAPSPTRLGRRN